MTSYFGIKGLDALDIIQMVGKEMVVSQKGIQFTVTIMVYRGKLVVHHLENLISQMNVKLLN
jgi:hypothetical protein